MAFVASQLIEEVTAHAQSDSLEDAREICADGTYFPNNLSNYTKHQIPALREGVILNYNRARSFEKHDLKKIGNASHLFRYA